MPRDSNGNYTLPAGNPVVTGTTIETAWANPTMDDIKQALTDSLDRYGRGGMQAPFRFVDGTAGQPGMSWASELSTGFYRAGAADMRATVAGVPQMRWTGTGVAVWDSVASSWKALTGAAGANFALLNEGNTFTESSKVVRADPAWALWKDETPTRAGRISLNISAADYMSVDYFDGSDWYPFIQSNILATDYFGNAHSWRSSGGLTYASLDVTNFTLANKTVRVWQESNLGLFLASVTGAGVVYDTNAGYPHLFRVSGIPRFTVDANACRLVSQPAGTGTATWQADDGGNVFWNTSGPQIGYQWYTGGQLHLTASPTGLIITTYNGNATANDLYINRTGGVGGNFAGQNAWIQLWNETQGEGWGLQVGTQGEKALRFYGFNAGWAERIRFDFNGIALYGGGGLSILPADNAASYQLRLSSSSSQVSPIFSGKGAVLFHNDPSDAYGGIFISTSAAPPSGGTPGQIWLQV